MIETIGHLKMQDETPVCIGVHAIFAEMHFRKLKIPVLETSLPATALLMKATRLTLAIY
jgi:hypothetical protein